MADYLTHTDTAEAFIVRWFSVTLETKIESYNYFRNGIGLIKILSKV